MPGWRTMLVMVLPIAGALVLVALWPGGLRSVLLLRLRGLPLIWVAAAVQLVRFTDPRWAAPLP